MKACAKRGGRGALFASSVSLTSPLRSEVPGKTKVATSISRSIPFHPAPSKPYVSGRNADASKSGRILRFSRRSTGREKPPRPYGGGQRTCRAGCARMRLALVFQLAARPIMRRARRSRPTDAGGSMPSGTPDPPHVRYLILIIIANIRNKAGFRSRDPLRRNSEWDIRRNAVPKSQTDIAMLIRRNGECWLR